MDLLSACIEHASSCEQLLPKNPGLHLHWPKSSQRPLSGSQWGQRLSQIANSLGMDPTWQWQRGSGKHDTSDQWQNLRQLAIQRPPSPKAEYLFEKCNRQHYISFI